MYEEPIFGRNKSSHPGVDDLNMNTVTVLGDPSPFPGASFDFFLLTHHGQFPRSEDERMVTPRLRCKRNLEDQLGQSTSVFSASQVLTAEPLDDEEDTIPVTIMKIQRRG